MPDNQTFYCARFYITYRCNSRCVYCNAWQDQKFKNISELSLDDAKLLIHQCYQHGVRYIDFTGGEPTLYPHLAGVLVYAKQLGIKTEVTSNCIASRSRDKMLQVAATADKFNTSLDTLDARDYAAIRGVDKCGAVKNTIREIAKIRSPKIMTVVTDRNVADLSNMISYAQNSGAMIYLSPMFPYLDKDGIYRPSKHIDRIIAETYKPYTIVLLHFMEFFRDANADHVPPCSANKYTLTFGPNGDIVLPCYHASSDKIPWNKNLDAALSSPVFQQYRNLSGNLPQCKGCSVIPYFGISFNYQLNKYFLLQSYSEKLSHLKRDILNPVLLKHPSYTDGLQTQLDGLLDMVRHLSYVPDTRAYKTSASQPLYPARPVGNGFSSPVYKDVMSPQVYDKERTAPDCWALTQVPHNYFDMLCRDVIIPMARQGGMTPATEKLVASVLEFQIRWWRFYIGQYMKLTRSYDITGDRTWLTGYLNRLGAVSPHPVLAKGLSMLSGR